MYEACGDGEAAAVEEKGSEDQVVVSWVACAVPEVAEGCKSSWFISGDSVEGPDG